MNGLTDLLTHPAFSRLGWTLMHFLWQGAAIAAALAIALPVLRRASANARYLTACAALVLMVAAPSVTFWRLKPGATFVRTPAVADEAAVVGHALSPIAPPAPAGTAPLPTSPTPRPRPTVAVIAPMPWHVRAMDWIEARLAWFVVAWICGVTLLSARLVLGWFGVQRLRRAGRTVTDALQARLDRLAEALRVSRPVRLLENATARTPVVIGWLKPVVLAPASLLAELPPEQLDAILAHELAHVLRHDYLANLLQTAAETLLFYHPAVHWVSHRIRIEREHCCDDLAARTCGDPAACARALASLAEMPASAPRLAPAAGGHLLVRIQRLLLPAPLHTSRAGLWVAPALLAGFVLAAVAGGLAWGESAEAEGPASEFRIAVLSDCDETFRGKGTYSDTLMLHTTDGAQVWQRGGLNTCQAIGGAHGVVWNPIDRSLWLTELVGNRILKFGADGAPLPLDAALQPADRRRRGKADLSPGALAADPKTGNMWILTSGSTIYGHGIAVLASDGRAVARHAVDAFDIAYSPHDDCFWLAGKYVTKLSRDGAVLLKSRTPFPWCAVSVAANERDGSVCVLERRHPDVADSRNRLHILSSEGTERTLVDLGDIQGDWQGALCVAVDGKRERIWVATSAGLIQLTTGGTEVSRTRMNCFSVCIEPDTGCAWAGGKDGLWRINTDGAPLLRQTADRSYCKWLCAVPVQPEPDASIKAAERLAGEIEAEERRVTGLAFDYYMRSGTIKKVDLDAPLHTKDLVQRLADMAVAQASSGTVRFNNARKLFWFRRGGADHQGRPCRRTRPANSRTRGW